MTISLPEPIFALARQQAAEAGYASVSDYFESLVERADSQRAERAETIAAVRVGLADVAAGRTRPAAEVFAELARKHNIPTRDSEG